MSPFFFFARILIADGRRLGHDGIRKTEEIIKPGMVVELEKEPDNEWDREAIKIKMPGLGQIGYAANSVHTVVGESHSAGRLYDKIGDTACGKVLYNMGAAVVCELVPNDGQAE